MTTRAGAPAGSVYAAALRGLPCTVHGLDDEPSLLPAPAWGGSAAASDRALLAHCLGRTLDIGCGPGRMAHHLSGRGTRVLGVDVVPEAVRQTRARGTTALLADVFDPLPDEGRWRTVLLADGNIGIGGDPCRLLCRVRELLAPGGRVVLDIAPPGTGLRTAAVSLECDGRRSRPFAWSVVGPEALGGLAASCGFVLALTDSYEGRWFAVLEARG